MLFCIILNRKLSVNIFFHDDDDDDDDDDDGDDDDDVKSFQY